MIVNRNAWWAALLLAVFVGCNKPEGANEGTTPPPVTPGNSPETPPPAPATKPEEVPAPAPAAKEEMPKEPAVEAPKVEAPAIEPPKTEAPKEEAPKENQAEAVSLSDEELAEVKKLPAAEQELAMKQLVCPVSGESLGSMGVPIKVSAEGQTFFLCCKGCNKDLKADPKAVVAKLNQK